MSAWADADAFRDEHNARLRANAIRQLARKPAHMWHARMKDRAWLYLTRAGDIREWLQHQLSHAHNFERVSMIGLCTEVTGALIPALDGETSNHLTQKLDRVTCGTCRILLDVMLERATLKVDERTLRFLRRDERTLPQDDRGERCLMCGGRIETCGHFVGGGAL